MKVVVWQSVVEARGSARRRSSSEAGAVSASCGNVGLSIPDRVPSPSGRGAQGAGQTGSGRVEGGLPSTWPKMHYRTESSGLGKKIRSTQSPAAAPGEAAAPRGHTPGAVSEAPLQAASSRSCLCVSVPPCEKLNRPHQLHHPLKDHLLSSISSDGELYCFRLTMVVFLEKWQFCQR